MPNRREQGEVLMVQKVTIRDHEEYAIETLRIVMTRSGTWLSRDPESELGPTLLAWADELEGWLGEPEAAGGQVVQIR